MTDARNSWNDAGEKLGRLGRKLKTHYESQHGDEKAPSRQGDTHGPSPQGDAQGPSRDDLTAAARRVGGAVQGAFEALGTAARDKAVQDDVKQVGQSVVGALGATFGQVSEDLRRVFNERKGDVARPADPTSTPTPTPTPTSTPAPAPAPAPAEPPTAPPAPGTGEAGDTPPKVEPWGTP